MAKEINITIENKLGMAKRDMTIYHHSSRSAHMISPESSITLPLRPVMEDDYLHISIVNGPGRLESICVVNLPSWVDFEIFSAGDATVTHSDGRILLKIPPGVPTWQLRMKRSLSFQTNQSSDCVIIVDDQHDGIKV